MTEATSIPAHDSYDVLVIGGGPSGATAATLVAQQGHRVLLAEKSSEPQFKIGESLMPATYWTLERLGMLDKMRASSFPRKYSVQFYSKSGRASKPFYFFENDPHECSQTWQVLRSRFDQMLLDNAEEHGVEVRRGLMASRVLFDDDGRAVGAEVQEGDGPPRRVEARVVVDASGQNALLARRFGLIELEPRMRNISFFSHFRGARRDPGIDEGATLVINTSHGKTWFWYIPLPDDVVSVGVVGPLDYLVKGRGGDPAATFAEELAMAPAVRARIVDAEQLFPIRARRDFSYRARQIAGDGWVLVGDAFGFIDPIYSTGVLLALKSGEMAADAINEGLARGDLSGRQLGSFGIPFTEGMEALRRLVYTYYAEGFSFSRFLRAHPHCRRDIVMLLTGNVYREKVGDLFERLSETIDLPAAPPFDPPTVAASAAARG
jgi:flavin-dependent dehydrogenase